MKSILRVSLVRFDQMYSLTVAAQWCSGSKEFFVVVVWMFFLKQSRGLLRAVRDLGEFGCLLDSVGLMQVEGSMNY